MALSLVGACHAQSTAPPPEIGTSQQAPEIAFRELEMRRTLLRERRESLAARERQLVAAESAAAPKQLAALERLEQTLRQHQREQQRIYAEVRALTGAAVRLRRHGLPVAPDTLQVGVRVVTLRAPMVVRAQPVPSAVTLAELAAGSQVVWLGGLIAEPGWGLVSASGQLGFADLLGLQ